MLYNHLFHAAANPPHHHPLSSIIITGPPRAVSRISSWRTGPGTNFHWMRNVAVDFSKMATNGNARSFSPGFITAVCDPHDDFLGENAFSGNEGLKGLVTVATPPQPAHIVIPPPEPPSGDPVLECSEWVTTPTIVIQHDDIGENSVGGSNHLSKVTIQYN